MRGGHLHWEGLRGGRDVLVGPKGRKGHTCHVLLTPLSPQGTCESAAFLSVEKKKEFFVCFNIKKDLSGFHHSLALDSIPLLLHIIRQSFIQGKGVD